MLSSVVHHDASAHRVLFDGLAALPVRRVSVAPARREDLEDLLRIAVRQIPALSAAGPAVERVWTSNPESILAFRRADEIVGCYAMLLFNEIGLGRFLSGSFDASDPDVACLSRPGQRVAAIYKWAVVAPGLAAEGIRAVSRRLQEPAYASANFYACATTAPAARLMAHLGFEPVPNTSPELLRYVRQASRTRMNDVAA